MNSFKIFYLTHIILLTITNIVLYSSISEVLQLSIIIIIASYMALAFDITDGRGLSNEARR